MEEIPRLSRAFHEVHVLQYAHALNLVSVSSKVDRLSIPPAGYSDLVGG